VKAAGDVPLDNSFPTLTKQRYTRDNNGGQQRTKYKPLLKRNNSSAENLNNKTDDLTVVGVAVNV
jgi:hypothetical protein